MSALMSDSKFNLLDLKALWWQLIPLFNKQASLKLARAVNLVKEVSA